MDNKRKQIRNNPCQWLTGEVDQESERFIRKWGDYSTVSETLTDLENQVKSLFTDVTFLKQQLSETTMYMHLYKSIAENQAERIKLNDIAASEASRNQNRISFN